MLLYSNSGMMLNKNVLKCFVQCKSENHYNCVLFKNILTNFLLSHNLSLIVYSNLVLSMV